MRRSAAVLITDALDAADSVAAIVKGLSLEAYRDSRLHRAAVERELMIIGEAIGALRALDPSLAERVPDASRVIGLRNRLAHAYDVIDDSIIHGVATLDLPRLRDALAGLLGEFPG